MRYFECHDGNYITTFGKAAHGGETITEERYDALALIVANAPVDTETITHRLKTDLTWEEVSIEPVDPEPTDEDYSEAGRILMGVEE